MNTLFTIKRRRKWVQPYVHFDYSDMITHLQKYGYDERIVSDLINWIFIQEAKRTFPKGYEGEFWQMRGKARPTQHIRKIKPLHVQR